MINWQRTLEIFGIKETDKIPKKNKQQLVLSCDKCNSEVIETRIHHTQIRFRYNKQFLCPTCRKELAKINYIVAAKKRYLNPEYMAKQKAKRHTEEYKIKARQRSNELWQNEEYKAKFKAGFKPDVARHYLNLARKKSNIVNSKKLKLLWQNPEYRKRTTQKHVDRWLDNNYRQKVINGLKKYYSATDVLLIASERSKALWATQQYRENWLKSFIESFTEERLNEISLRSSKNWLNEEYRNKIEAHWTNSKREWMSKICADWWTDEYKSAISEKMITKWADPKQRAAYISAFKLAWTEDRRNAARAIWTDDKRTEMSIKTKKLWENPDFVSKIITMMTKPSSLEVQFASMLDDNNIQYKQQVHLGPYLFDFQINNILIEIQGDYWHSLPAAVNRDKSKATYVEKYLPEYQLNYLWEHEFYQLDKIHNFINTKFGIKHTIDYKLNDIIFKSAGFEEIQELCNKYHYKGDLGRRGHYFGAYLNNTLIAGCVFANPTRNVSGGELTRFIIHPMYQKPNLASWFLSKATKSALKIYDGLFTFADPNFNHFGTIYLASNWKYVGDTDKDYWYSSSDGWIMHKKTLWNRATNMCLKESEYATAFGYTKVWGLPKKKYVYTR